MCCIKWYNKLMKVMSYALFILVFSIPFTWANSFSIEIDNSANSIWSDTVTQTWKGKYIQLRSTKNKNSPIDELRCHEDHGSRLSIAHSYQIKMTHEVCLGLFDELKKKELKKIKLFFNCPRKDSCELVYFQDNNSECQ